MLYLDSVRAGCVPLHGSRGVLEPRGAGQVEDAGQEAKHFICFNHEGLNSTKQVLYLNSVRAGCVPLHGSGRVLEPRGPGKVEGAGQQVKHVGVLPSHSC